MLTDHEFSTLAKRCLWCGISAAEYQSRPELGYSCPAKIRLNPCASHHSIVIGFRKAMRGEFQRAPMILTERDQPQREFDWQRWGRDIDVATAAMAEKVTSNRHPTHSDVPFAPDGFYLSRCETRPFGSGVLGLWVHTFYFARIKLCEPIEGPPTFREWLEYKCRGRCILEYEAMPSPVSNEWMAEKIGYDGLALWLYPEQKSAVTYSRPEPKRWLRWIMLGSATGILAAILLSKWVRF